jgi:hypothetical protein
VIETLNEGSLHAQLKEWYRRPGDLVEHPVDDYLIDLVRGETLIEILTGGFAPLRRKLERLRVNHAVRLVVPVALSRRIIRISPGGGFCRRGGHRDAAGPKICSPGWSVCRGCSCTRGSRLSFC